MQLYFSYGSYIYLSFDEVTSGKYILVTAKDVDDPIKNKTFGTKIPIIKMPNAYQMGPYQDSRVTIEVSRLVPGIDKPELMINNASYCLHEAFQAGYMFASGEGGNPVWYQHTISMVYKSAVTRGLKRFASDFTANLIESGEAAAIAGLPHEMDEDGTIRIFNKDGDEIAEVSASPQGNMME